MSPQAVEGEFGLWVRQHNGPSKIVLISVMNAIYPITCEVLHKIAQPVAKVVRIVIFERLSVQAMVSFLKVYLNLSELASLRGSL